jgi:hypothetical protein
LPDAHQPHDIESQLCERIPLGGRHFCESDSAAEADGELFEPCPGVDS